MEIRLTQMEDMECVLQLYNLARQFQRKQLKLLQWSDHYPNYDTLYKDIASKGSYVALDKNEIIGTFFLQKGPDHTYLALKDQWSNIDEIVTVHRIAVKKQGQGCAKAMMQWIIQNNAHVMIDTHAENKAMLALIHSLGFKYIGEVQLEDGTNRQTYELIT